ncbi:hypothetical protein CO051_04055 [Candidatus Roizmanbacteria bacterium CG_4_9_14_0_2_um_filter_39_13]|uniref:Uncharacterized protein n=2 Tax=Candidatus Roizmaniibacteriota TaxID=1752723 RepID=A0A2M8EYI1_9BACT|nr:MAG: hypothetical protein COY15_01000 [Candidatus Roizmanbacteria bacterium CG_4_10_14_0_2_um_filter_39_12]PJC31610.1 MAG: hypothetical protein CO051_04055 [Candidatus Roizmanbacteria bacterium CG_4_9_14_0_2_um_filter_39_13]PJE61944.1 MAG: hypothetical protein COU87_01875 [Candidatus Roizmanbacteria bacterium CG10_big_fil_rev_8_21_14_0_10_39_12]
MDIYSSIVNTIIKQQTSIIGPIALSQAKMVAGIHFSDEGSADLQGDPKLVLDELVKKYEKLFGKASIEVCKDAVRELIPPVSPDILPDILK